LHFVVGHVIGQWVQRERPLIATVEVTQRVSEGAHVAGATDFLDEHTAVVFDDMGMRPHGG
jgi:hypothetical protein